MGTKSHGRAAAWTAAAISIVSAGFQFYWALGGTWALHAFSGGEAPPVSASDRTGIAIIGLVDLAMAGVLLVRVGYWREHVPFAIARFARIGAWVIAVLALGNALANFGAHTDFERFFNGPVNLIVALLAFVVARSELPVPPDSGVAPMPGRRPGSPTSAH